MKRPLVYASLVFLALLGITLVVVLIGRARDFEERVRKYDSVNQLTFTRCLS